MQIEASGLEWHISQGQGPDGGDVIVCFCQTKDDATIAVRIEDYPLHYFWMLPDDYEWDVETCEEVHKALYHRLGNNKRYMQPFVPEDFTYKEPLYYVSDRKPVIRLRFSSSDAARHSTNILNKGLDVNGSDIKGEVVEFDVDHVRKLLTEVDITHCQWFTCVGTVVPVRQKITTQSQEYRVKYRSIKSSACSYVPRPLFCAYDIEEYSHNHNKFPEAWDSKDDINVMSVSFARQGDAPELWSTYVICVCDYIIDDPVEADTIVVVVPDRIALIKKFAELICKYDPDILTGYNILAFDNKHLKAKLGIYGEEMPNIGRMIAVNSPGAGTSWSSSANKGKDLHWFQAPGRAFVDYYEHCTRTFNWPTYNLGHAATTILAKFPHLRKKDMPAVEQFRIYKEVLDTVDLPRVDSRRVSALKAMGRFLVYCKYDSTLVLHMAWATNWWIGLREMCNAVGSGLQKLLTNGQQQRVFSLLYHRCTKEGIVLTKRDKAEIFYYEGGIVQKPRKGITDLSPTYDFKSLYPSAMISYNLSHDTLIHPDDWHKYTPDQYIVATPLIGDQDIDSLDDIDAKKKKLDDIVWEEAEFRFLKKEIKEGVVPKILKLLLSERARVRGLEKKEGDALMKVVYDQRQLALKVCANSIYGFMGVKRGGKRPCLEISAATTFFGRDRITYTINWIVDNAHVLITDFYKANGWETNGGTYTAELIYGDTDSCMMHFPGVPYEYIHKLAHHIGRLATKEHEHLGPLELEMEGVFKICCIEQKHYAKFMYNDPEWGKKDLYVSKDGKPELIVKGLTPVRRDSCDFVRDVMSEILFSAMSGGTYSGLVDTLLQTVRKLYQGEVPIDQLVITKSMGAHYKSATATMNVFAQRMAAEGQEIHPGERHEYIVVTSRPGAKVSEKMILLTLYNSKPEGKRPHIDAEYYFSNLLKKKVDRLFEAIFERYARQCASVEVIKCGRVINGLTPAKMLHAGLVARNKSIFSCITDGATVITKRISEC